MPAVTPSFRYLAALGPIKMEVVNLPATTDSGDTFTTVIQRPLFGLLGWNTAGQTGAGIVTVSGKTVTVEDGAGTFSNKACTVVVFGF